MIPSDAVLTNETGKRLTGQLKDEEMLILRLKGCFRSVLVQRLVRTALTSQLKQASEESEWILPLS